ncbi:hypothetical protein RGQ13_13760 [Thalassotalea psychrophila]|uniref:Uncharacterized protein n=1 Tax=Thalassotalea psychrophila TaxID=3065647 RepID=A0ABY9TQR9_9GAMM|nr:hypothetical protein RGQ13_13760 [Colwelliaceae bacterium SQ149]
MIIQKHRLISIFILLIAILSVAPLIHAYSGIALINNTTIGWIIKSLFLVTVIFSINSYSHKRQLQMLFWVSLYLSWNVICIVRGAFIAENYWDYKGLITNALALCVPLVAYCSVNSILVKKIIKFLIIYTTLTFILILPIMPTDAYGFYLVPFSLILLFIGPLNNKCKLFLIVISLFVIFSDFGARSNVIKFVVPLILGMFYYFRTYFSLSLLNSIRIALFACPIILFSLASFGTFNVFKISTYIEGNYTQTRFDMKGDKTEDNLTADTRTFLYLDVLSTASLNDSWYFGRSPARGNISEHFGEQDMTGRNERLGNEVAILNVFTWTGLIGCVLLFLVYYKASFLAINNSDNVFSKILGLFLAFRWAYAWVEDVNNFSLNHVFLWVLIGMCYSTSFRKMTDYEFKVWVIDLFRFKIRYS